MNESDRKGLLAEVEVIRAATELNWTVSRPLSHARYDLILDDGSQLWRAQIKYADGKHSAAQGIVRASLRSHERTYHRGEIDVLLVYVPSVDKLLWFPPEIFEGRKDLQLRILPTLNNQKSGCLMIQPYIWPASSCSSVG